MNRLTVQDFTQYRFLSQPAFSPNGKSVAFVAQQAETMNGQIFELLCRNAGIQPKVAITTQNLITEVSLCMEGLGACVVPLSFFVSPSQRSTPLFSQEGLNRLAIFVLDCSEIENRTICVCRMKSKRLTRAGREFIHLAQEIYSGFSAGQIPPQFRFESPQ